MSLYVLDTDTLSLYQRGLPNVVAKVDAQHALDPATLAITVVTVEEEMTGWYTLLRQARTPDEEIRAYERLAESVPLLARWQIIPLSRPSLLRYETLKRMNLNVRQDGPAHRRDRAGDRRDPGLSQPPRLPAGPGARGRGLGVVIR